MADTFPAAAIRGFLAEASRQQAWTFAVSSAQRTFVVTQDSAGPIAAQHQEILQQALDLCWASTLITPASDDASALLPQLMARLVDDDDPGHEGFARYAVNDALAAAIFALRSDEDGNPYWAASRFCDLVDLIAHRGRSEYIEDLAADPLFSYAADCIRGDITRIPRLPLTGDALAEYRLLCVSQAHHLGALIAEQ